MSDKNCCILRGGGEDGPSEADRCKNDGVFPYYTDQVCEPCARSMLSDDVLPIETIAALITKDAALYARALGGCDMAGQHKALLGGWMTALQIKLGVAAKDAETLHDNAIEIRAR